jgi:hypothetical protein
VLKSGRWLLVASGHVLAGHFILLLAPFHKAAIDQGGRRKVNGSRFCSRFLRRLINWSVDYKCMLRFHVVFVFGEVEVILEALTDAIS